MTIQNSTNFSTTNYAVLVGAANGTISHVSPATTTIPQALVSGGASANPAFTSPSSYSFTMNRQVFTSSGTYTPTANMKYCIVECVGGGGGSGALTGTQTSTLNAQSGVNAGTYSRSVLSAASVGASQVITIGGGGAATATGGTTSVGSLITAPGGPGSINNALTTQVIGATVAQTAGAAGTASVAFRGCTGRNGIFAYVSTSALFSMGGCGGSTFFGGGGAGSGTVTNATKVNGNAATSYGGGAGGPAMGSNVSPTATGAAGFAGIIIITEIIHT